eukprot:11198081-Lingulodinium_polyedra.AAC.1
MALQTTHGAPPGPRGNSQLERLRYARAPAYPATPNTLERELVTPAVGATPALQILVPMGQFEEF